MGGAICGANWLTPPPDRDEQCQLLVERLSAEGFQVHSVRVSVKELPILADLDRLTRELSNNEPWEAVILMDLNRILEVAARLTMSQEQFPHAVITLVGSPRLLGSPSEYFGDPDGVMASLAISQATRGEIKPAGIYVADPNGCYPWQEAALEVRLHSTRDTQ